ncbi:MAG: hypothetical protein WCJ64_24410 [Rhodospirillaceae bacterium]
MSRRDVPQSRGVTRRGAPPLRQVSRLTWQGPAPAPQPTPPAAGSNFSRLRAAAAADGWISQRRLPSPSTPW